MVLFSVISSEIDNFRFSSVISTFLPVSFRAKLRNLLELSACYSPVSFWLSERSERMEKSPFLLCHFERSREIPQLESGYFSQEISPRTAFGRDDTWKTYTSSLESFQFFHPCHLDWSVSGMEKFPLIEMFAHEKNVAKFNV